MTDTQILKLVECLKNGNFKAISFGKISEVDLYKIAMKLQEEDFEVKTLINIILRNTITEDCDWNIGSLLQHFDYNTIISCLDRVPLSKRGFLYDSIGFCWALGECPYKSDSVIQFLYEVIDNARNSESWWRAAFALEKLTRKNAINNLKRSMKNNPIKSLDDCLDDLGDKKNLISILLNASSDDIKNKIYPRLKEIFNTTEDEKELINVVWLLGRLRLYDEGILTKSIELLDSAHSYETKFYILQSMIDDPKPEFAKHFERLLSSEDLLIKKMAIWGIGELGDHEYVSTLEDMLAEETNQSVIAALTKAIYMIKSKHFSDERIYMRKYLVNENGLIGDDSDKWYADSTIYNMFSESEDPENICFRLIFGRVLKEKLKIYNPIDLATGTGRAAKYLLNHVSYDGTLYAIDYSQQMLDYFERTINRQKYYVKNIELVHSKIQDFTLPNNDKSSFIISSFGFPSKISDLERCQLELEQVYKLLSDDGVFVTLGWDETFNDDLNNMWYKYIPDNIKAASFEEWRRAREASIKSARNCDLTWYKQNIKVPLLYDTLEETINIMGHLFGRDAATEILNSKKTMWWMSLGITWDNKESLSRVLKK